MKVKIVLVGLGLLMFIFCSVGLSQAAMSPKNNVRFLTYPSEHPWQHDDSPGPPDSSDSGAPRMVILPVSSTINSILLIRIPRGITGSGEKTADVGAYQKGKQHLQGKR